MMTQDVIGLFEATGIELEFMIVDRKTLDIRPICDRIFEVNPGEAVATCNRGTTRWSHGPSMHHIATETSAPMPSLTTFQTNFHDDVTALNKRLSDHQAMLLPTGMHPWMNPKNGSFFGPHEHGEIYRRLDHVFGCKGHGWNNLQSMRIHLPFGDDREFEQLHRAIRLLLPIMPGLSASSPFVEGEQNAIACNRLRFYAGSCRRVPLITSRVIPEDITSAEEYQEEILLPMYRQLGKLDPEGLLKHEWLNARGAIARFAKGTVEIRVLDTQESSQANMLVAELIRETMVNLVQGTWSELDRTATWATEDLADLYDDVVVKAEKSIIRDQSYLDFFHYPDTRATVSDLWHHLLETGRYENAAAYTTFLAGGSLSSRIRSYFTVRKPERDALREVYRELAGCLANNSVFPGYRTFP